MYKCPPGYDIVSAILPFVSSLLCVCSSVLSWKNQCQSWRLYLSFMAVNDAIAFFLFFFFHLPHEHFFFPPFLQFNGSCIHGWTENVPPLNLGPNFYTQNVFLSLSVSLIYLCEITSCNIWLWECQRFFLVVWFIITVSLLPFSPSYVQWMYFSMH